MNKAKANRKVSKGTRSSPRTRIESIESTQQEVIMEETVDSSETLAASSSQNTERESSRIERNLATSSKTCQQIIYNIKNSTFEKPKFEGRPENKPMVFLEDLEQYIKKVGEGKEVDLIIDCLINDARDWARIYKDRWNTFDDFKKDFLATFWGEKEQSILRRQIVQGTWERSCGTMSIYFLRLVGQAQNLTYKIPEKQLISDIIKHYPKYVQQGFITTKCESIIETADYLRNMDDIREQEIPPSYNKTKPSTSSNIFSNKERENRKRQYQQGYKNWKNPTNVETVEISNPVNDLN